MKRLIALLFATVLIVSIIGTSVAAYVNPATCSHRYCSFVPDPNNRPTCESSGREIYTCNACGKKLSYRTVARLGHSWSLISSHYDNFTHKWTWTFRCSECKKTTTTEKNSYNSQHEDAIWPAR